MKCKKCGDPLTGKQKRWCSPECSKLGLKAEYKKRNKAKVLAYNREYRSKGVRPIKRVRKQKTIKERGGICERCGTSKKLQVHHIKPARVGGTNELRNLLVLCDPCHKEWEKRMKKYWDVVK